MTAPVWLVEIVAYTGAGTATLRYGSAGHVTGPAETPASTVYDARLKQPADLRRFAFAAGATQGRSQIAAGDVLLENSDGALDALLDYGFDGHAITLRKGTAGAAYPAGFPVVFTGTMEQAEFVGDVVRIRLKDTAFKLDVPLQATTFAGDNVLPAGLEGVAGDLKGVPKPLLFGVVKNVAPPCVNTAKLIYQLNDGAVASVEGVYDRGIALGTTLYLLAGGGTPSNSMSSSGDGAAFSVSAGVLPSGIAVTCSVIGASGIIVLGAGTAVLYSTTGDNWTSATISVGFQIQGLAFDGTTYVAVGDGGQIWTSTNLTAWTSRTSGFGTTNINGVVFGGTKFLAVGDAGKASSSPSGTTWTAETTGFGAAPIFCVTYGAGVYVIAGNAGTLSTSPDGATYTSRTSGTSSGITTLTYGGSLFVLGTSAGEIVTSPTAVTWTKRVSPFAAAETINASVYGDGLWLVAGGNGLAATSSEGVRWQMVSTGYAAGAFELGAAVYATNLGTGNYANATDLADDAKAPVPGSYKTYLAGGYLRLGSPPAGLITADVTQGAAAADRTAGSLFENVLTKAGYTSADWVAADVTALDAASAVIGLWCPPEMTVAEALDLVAGTVGAWWGPRASDGDYRIVQFLAPTGSPVVSFTANDLIGPPERIAANDLGRGLPVWRTVLRYARHYVTQDTDLAGGVTDARRAALAQEWRETANANTAVQTAHLLAIQTVEETLYSVAADALTEATRRQTLRGTRRDRIEFTVEWNTANAALDVGDVISLDHPRYGLSGGSLLRVIGLAPNARARELTITGWK